MKPCNCHDAETAKKLNEQGFAINNDSIELVPAVVILKIDACTLKINQFIFEKMARWYIENLDEGMAVFKTKDDINENWIKTYQKDVELKVGSCKLQISSSIFYKFARWYLEDQEHE